MAVLSTLTGALILSGIHTYKKRKGNAAEYDYTDASLRAVLSMLVHGGYFQDLNRFGDVAATFLGYQNPRAENYGKRHWESLPEFLRPSWKSKSEPKELGLQFLLRKDPHPTSGAPRLAIVVRGTIPYSVRDLLADIKIAVEQLHNSNRVSRTRALILEVVRKFRDYYGPEERICMSGHSLGAAIALQVRKKLYLNHRIDIDTHLFNPPLVTLVDIVTLRVFPGSHARSATSRVDIAALWSKLFRGDRALEEEWTQFQKLEGWVPHFYLNPKDPVCHLFIKYFKERHDMTTTAAQDTSPQGFFALLFSKNANLIPNVVPSAHVYISEKYAGNPLKAHSLRQWHKFTNRELPFRYFQARLLAPDRSMAHG